MTDGAQFDEGAGDAPATARAGRIASGFRIVSLLTLASRILGLVRDMGMAALFGAGPLMDAFSVAFRVPNLARRLFGEGALTAAFLPVFVGELERGGRDSARRLATAVFVTLARALLALVIFAELALWIVHWVCPLGPDARLLIQLTAEMLPYLLLICLTAQVSAVLQSLERFTWPALAPVILNGLWIGTLVVVAMVVDDPRTQLHLVALSIVAAGVVQFGAPLIALQRSDIRLTRRWRSATPLVRDIIRAMIPVMLGLSITQLNTLCDSLLAWGLAAPSQPPRLPRSVETPGVFDRWPLEQGTASALYFAQRMYQFPLGVFGVALGTVLFPLLSRHAERGEMDHVRHDLSLGLRLVAAIGLPASVGLVLLREPIAVLFFQRGAFTSEDAAFTAQYIAAYGVGVWAYVGLLIIHRGFYAVGDRTTPMHIGLWAVGINLVLNLTLVWPLAGVGLALATAAASMIQMLLVCRACHHRIGLLDLDGIQRTIGRAIVATVAMSAACLATAHFAPTGESALERIVGVAGPMTAAVAAYLLAAKSVGLDEPFLLLHRSLEDDDE